MVRISVNVFRFGSLTDVSYPLQYVRFTLKIGHGKAIDFANEFANEPRSTACHRATQAGISASEIAN
jgi:hypothetical protein